MAISLYDLIVPERNYLQQVNFQFRYTAKEMCWKILKLIETNPRPGGAATILGITLN
jgi:hypothetical protein